jgi:hypothetical protein
MQPHRIPGAAFLRRAVFRPSNNGRGLFHAFATCLTEHSGEGDLGLPELLSAGHQAGQLASHLQRNADDPGFLLTGALGRITDQARSQDKILPNENAKLIVVIDQLEEVFSAVISAEERHQFVRLMAGLARCGAVWVVAALRSDLWHRASEIPELIALSEGYRRIEVLPPTTAELMEMIRKPAQSAGLAFEMHPVTGVPLDALIAQDAAHAPGALALVSFVLDELYRRDVLNGGGRVLTNATYEQMGGPEGVIAARAEEVVSFLSPQEQAYLPILMRNLVSFTAGAENRFELRTAPIASFDPQASPLIEAMTRARLLVASSDHGAATVRLAHQALIENWPRAREIIVSEAALLRIRARVEAAALQWQAVGRDRDYLIPAGRQLAEAEELMTRWGGDLPPDIADFVRRSVANNRWRWFRFWQ